MATNRSDKEQQVDCPVPHTHSRLEQAHRLWHQALENYDDPEGFRANLNSTIEALRNVTFMLQSEKSIVPDFDAWHPEQQAEMKADMIMKWVNDARTTVVHRSDLEVQSSAHATIHNNLTLAQRTLDLQPLVPAMSMAEKTYLSHLHRTGEICCCQWNGDGAFHTYQRKHLPRNAMESDVL